MPVDVLIKAQEPEEIRSQGFQFRRGHVIEACLQPTQWTAKEGAPAFARITVVDSMSKSDFLQYLQPNSSEWKFDQLQLDSIMSGTGLASMTLSRFKEFMAVESN